MQIDPMGRQMGGSPIPPVGPFDCTVDDWSVTAACARSRPFRLEPVNM